MACTVARWCAMDCTVAQECAVGCTVAHEARYGLHSCAGAPYGLHRSTWGAIRFAQLRRGAVWHAQSGPPTPASGHASKVRTPFPSPFRRANARLRVQLVGLRFRILQVPNPGFGPEFQDQSANSRCPSNPGFRPCKQGQNPLPFPISAGQTPVCASSW